MLHFFKKLRLNTKLILREYIKYSHQNVFAIICVCYLSVLSLSCSHRQMSFFATGTSQWTTVSSVKSISVVTFVGKWSLVDIYDLFDILFFFFTQLTLLFVFSKSNVLIVPIGIYPVPPLNWVFELAFKLGQSLINRNCEWNVNEAIHTTKYTYFDYTYFGLTTLYS